jgi:hypothetical protein
MPGILTGIAAVIGSITAAIVVFQTQGNQEPSPTPPTSRTEEPSPTPTTPEPTTPEPTTPEPTTPEPTTPEPPTSRIEESYLVGNWEFSGTSRGQSVTGSIMFNDDGSYIKTGYVGTIYAPDTGSYVFNNLAGTIQLTSYAYGNAFLYLMNNFQANSFHVSAPGEDYVFRRQ